jgi:hypothetical protein
MWDITRIALDFFSQYLPFGDMKSADGLLSGSRGFCFAKEGESYAVYLTSVGAPQIDLGLAGGRYSVFWLNPREGGGLQKGTVETVLGKGMQSIGRPAGEPDEDWVALVRKYPKY